MELAPDVPTPVVVRVLLDRLAEEPAHGLLCRRRPRRPSTCAARRRLHGFARAWRCCRAARAPDCAPASTHGRGGARSVARAWAPVMGQPPNTRRAAPKRRRVCVRSDGRLSPRRPRLLRGEQGHWRLSNASTTRCPSAKLANDSTPQVLRRSLPGLGIDGSRNGTARKFRAGLGSAGAPASNKLAKRIRPRAHARGSGASSETRPTRPTRRRAGRAAHDALEGLPKPWVPSAAK